MIRRRPIVLFTLSFLDVICCGFGAIILLFVLTIGSQTVSLRELQERLQNILRLRMAELVEFRSRREDLMRTAAQSEAVTEEARKRQETLKLAVSRMEIQIERQLVTQQELLAEIQKLKEELSTRQKTPERVLPIPKSPVGIPIGNSTHIAIVIDTSGSMRDPANERIWPVVIQKIEEVLDIYPNVKGIQVLDTDGRFILGRNTEDWLPDTPEVREHFKQAIRRYTNYSESSPVNGVLRALRRLYNPSDLEMKMNIYIFGDEFAGGTADPVLQTFDRLNPADANGKRSVTISAVGFPTAVQVDFAMDNTGVKYANLMREVTYRHGGAFIVVVDY